jgi:chorismate dehydratase
MNLPVPLYYGKKIIFTADGSITFYSLEYNEGYRAKSVGAFTESLHKFINPSGVRELIKKKSVAILDLCTGAGYNLAVLLDILSRLQERYDLYIVTVDKDEKLKDIINNSLFLWPSVGFDKLRKLLKGENLKGITFNYYVIDVRTFLNSCYSLFDIIFFDPFSKKNNSELWNTEIYKKLYDLLRIEGKVLTYASSKAIINDFKTVGFRCKRVPKLLYGFSDSVVFIK